MLFVWHFREIEWLEHITFNDKIEAFIKKLTIWKNSTEDGNLEMFAATDDYLPDNNLSNLLIVKVIVNHLNSIHAHFWKYFSGDIDSGKKLDSWTISNQTVRCHTPVIKSPGRVCIFIKRQKFEISIFKTDFMWFLDKDKKWIPNPFWPGPWQTLALLHNICEEAFSKLTTIKSKNRSSLKTVEDALRPALSCIIPRMCKKHQAHSSH